MARSLIQTLVCVLLVNGSLYALHLTGNSQSVGIPSGGVSEIGKLDSSTSSMSQPAPQLPIIPHQKSSSYYAHSKSASPQTYDSLNEELADLAQLERERLMLMGLAKQTAEDISYNGRPIITGRIKMHASKGLNEDDSDNPSSSTMQQARAFIYGNIRHRPAQHWPTQHLFSNDNESGDDRDYDGGGIYERRHPSTFEFGHIVQPSNERQFENLDDLNLDEFVELESVPDVEDVPDIDGYVYLDELLTEQNKERLQHHYQEQSPYLASPAYRQKLSRLHYHDPTPSQFEDFFKNEQNQHNSQPVSLPAIGLSPQYRQNKHLQQKWQRKRNPHLMRHIFGNTNGNRMQLEPQPLPQSQFSGLTPHPNQLHSRESVQKLATASSEATATTKLNFNNKYKQSNVMKNNNDNTKSKNINTQSPSPFKDVVDDQKSNESQQQPQTSLIKHGIINEASSPDAISMGNKIQQQLEEEQKLQTPNHKRSSLKAEKVNGQSPQQFGVHSLANQLMLRTARGQRQYDVPQIECPTAMDGMERFACPTPDVQGRYRCIDDHVLCDGFIDCPEGEDEDRRSCMFYKTTKAHLDVLADALLRWARGR